MTTQVTTPMHQHPTRHPSQTTAQPMMADVWNDFPQGHGTLVDAVQQRLHQHAPLVPVYVADASASEPRMRPRPCVDPLAWSLLKNAIQLALVGSVVMFALYGGRAPLMALGYVGTGLLLMGALVIADRLRFADRDPDFAIIEFLAPDPVPVVVHEMRPAPLAPLVEQMQVVMPETVAVT